ncbi:O-phosphoseryl-tRNA synthetase [archaeon BMS3Abin16]|nr:O-phosphoseryl-tRNA synthetase [archaeon BMS3Abin16]
MGRWNSKEVAKTAKTDFEGTWQNTKNLATTRGEKTKKTNKPGTVHQIGAAISKLRSAYIQLGFDETINPLFIEDTEVHKQFGPEAVAVLDRVYFLAGLPRPDIGVSEKKLSELKKFNPELSKNSLEQVLREYKTGEIEGDDFIAELSQVLNTDDTSALKALDTVFPEFKALKPKASNMTLRSHMTSGWFLTLQALYGKRELPIQLFSIDRCFRREQQEDCGHLRSYHSASCVVVDESFTFDEKQGITEGMDIVEQVFKKLRIGIKSMHARPDEKRSKYYAPDTQFEVFGTLPPGGSEVEVATMGLYSPVALSKYGVEHPVLNIGFGVERLAMVRSGAADIRELVYPQFYTALALSDTEIAAGITLARAPSTVEGREIADKILSVGRSNAAAVSPCTFEVYKGSVGGRDVVVSLVEEENNTRLLGPAALNKIFVFDGGVYGVSPSKGSSEVLEKGLDTGFSYLSAVAALAASEIEEAAASGESAHTTQVKGVKLPSDINLSLTEVVVRSINSKNKKIDIRGPVFTTIRAEFS